MISLHPTKTACWHSLVTEAQESIGYYFEESIECYLILTLDAYTSDKSLASSILALDFLYALKENSALATNKLRRMGDQCLLLAGLFPEHVTHKNVTIDYFIQIGRKAYDLIASNEILHPSNPELFFKLSHQFINLMDVLQVMRDISVFKEIPPRYLS